MRRRIWVAVLHVSERTAAKITATHNLEVGLLRDAVVGVSGLVCTWEVHSTRGRRALLEIWVGRRRVLVVLYPVGADPDEYHLGSAYPLGD